MLSQELEEEIFAYANEYIKKHSEYDPYIYNYMSQSNAVADKFPRVYIQLANDPLYSECTDKTEQKIKVTFEIEIYTVDTTEAVRQKIRKELTNLVDDVFANHYGFKRRTNRNLPNLDVNIDRQYMRYQGIVDDNKRIYRG